jgi:hypothetical protein
MKQLKALDLLKLLRDDYIHGELSSDINEAIAELEALQAPKSCDGCKFGKFGVDSVGLEVECELNWNCSVAYANRYEPKDSKNE